MILNSSSLQTLLLCDKIIRNINVPHQYPYVDQGVDVVNSFKCHERFSIKVSTRIKKSICSDYCGFQNVNVAIF